MMAEVSVLIRSTDDIISARIGHSATPSPPGRPTIKIEPMDTDLRPKRTRRSGADLARNFECDAPDCGRKYASQHALRSHYRNSHMVKTEPISTVRPLSPTAQMKMIASSLARQVEKVPIQALPGQAIAAPIKSPPRTHQATTATGMPAAHRAAVTIKSESLDIMDERGIAARATQQSQQGRVSPLQASMAAHAAHTPAQAQRLSAPGSVSSLHAESLSPVSSHSASQLGGSTGCACAHHSHSHGFDQQQQQQDVVDRTLASLLGVPPPEPTRNVASAAPTTVHTIVSPATTPSMGQRHMSPLGCSAELFRNSSDAAAATDVAPSRPRSMSEQDYYQLARLSLEQTVAAAMQQANAQPAQMPLSPARSSAMGSGASASAMFDTTPVSSHAPVSPALSAAGGASGLSRHARRWSESASPYHRRLSVPAVSSDAFFSPQAPVSSPLQLQPTVHELSETAAAAAAYEVPQALQSFILSPVTAPVLTAQSQQQHHQAGECAYHAVQVQQPARRSSLLTQKEYIAAHAWAAAAAAEAEDIMPVQQHHQHGGFVQARARASSLSAPPQPLNRAGSWDPSINRALFMTSPSYDSMAAAHATQQQHQAATGWTYPLPTQPTVSAESIDSIHAAATTAASAPTQQFVFTTGNTTTAADACTPSTASFPGAFSFAMDIDAAAAAAMVPQSQPMAQHNVRMSTASSSTTAGGVGNAAEDAAYVEAILQTLHVTGRSSPTMAVQSSVDAQQQPQYHNMCLLHNGQRVQQQQQQQTLPASFLGKFASDM